MNIIAPIGHNNPPFSIDDALAPFGDYIEEAQAWADGSPVTNAEQMAAVDLLIKQIKAAEKAVNDARDDATKPLHAAWQEEIARWKPTIVDLDRIKKCLLSAVDTFKRAEAVRKETARKEAERLAWEATRAAHAASVAADASNIEAQRAAAEAQAEAARAQQAATAAKADTVKGLRWYDMHEVTDRKALLNWIVTNDREAVTAFIDAYAEKNHKRTPMAGVRTWREQRAF